MSIIQKQIQMNVMLGSQVAYELEQQGKTVMNKFKEFLDNFQTGEGAHPYQEQARELVRNESQTLFVNMSDIYQMFADLADLIVYSFYRYEQYLLQGLQAFMVNYKSLAEGELFHLSFYNLPSINKIRDLRTNVIGQLTTMSGTITRSSEVRPELMVGTFECKVCNYVIKGVGQQFKYTQPKKCLNANCGNQFSWELLVSESEFTNFQKLRVQELSEDIPPGGMPRSMEVVLRNEMVDTVTPGEQCVFTGTLIVVPDIVSLLKPGEKTQVNTRGTDAIKTSHSIPQDGVTGLKQLGVRDLSYKMVFLANFVQSKSLKYDSHQKSQRGPAKAEDLEENKTQFSAEVLREVEEMSRCPNIYDLLAQSLAPGVHGYLEIKRGILLMLMGGVHKKTQSQTKIRGDLNICVVGDPSCAKSQFLKYVAAFQPRSVYTSGKASTAAGLTASVRRDPESGEMCIEAGALMLADNSICCIDEFDKMDSKDQVAIHEAMEQQTISLAKAGIHATLNARTSILAAANPIYGRYDKSKSLRYNLNISAPILSRFDLFYVVLDENNEYADTQLASYIVNLHRYRETAVTPHFSKEQLANYISFYREIQPFFTQEASLLLRDSYIRIRKGDNLDFNGSYRITVRQLESLIRLSEALAKVHGSMSITAEYVKEAERLLTNSILKIEKSDVEIDDEKEVLMEAPQENLAQQELQRQDKKENKITITYDLYKSVAQSMIYYVKTKMQRQTEEHPEEEEYGVLQQEIVEYYIDEVEKVEQVQNEQQRHKVQQICDSVINRLINKENILIVIQDHPTRSQRKLVLHDNYVGN